MSTVTAGLRQILDAGEATQRASERSSGLRAALDDLARYIRRYVVVTEPQQLAIVLWTAHTHAIDAADCTPYLQITSATKRAGKTRLLEVLEPLVARPWLTGRVSAAALCRKVDADRPTLLLDESDAALGVAADREYSEALRSLLNSGYRRRGRSTICVGQGANLTTRDFCTYGPKAIAGIGELPGTIADRSITIELRRRTSDEPCARWRERDGHAEAGPLHQQLVAWATSDVLEGLRKAFPELPSGLSDRQADVWEPLLAIADLAGGNWPERARDAALALAGASEDTDIVVELLTDIDGIIAADDERPVIPSSELLAGLIERSDRPWAEWRQGRPLTARGLSRLLAPLRIVPVHLRAFRGYHRDALQDAIARYLPSHVSQRHGGPDSMGNVAIPVRHDEKPRDASPSVTGPIATGSVTDRQMESGNGGRMDAERL